MRGRAEVIEAATDLRVVDSLEGLRAIREKGCAAAIWRRRVAPDFQAWIDAVEPALLPKGRVILRPERARVAAAHLCDAAGLPDGPMRALLVDDAAAMALMFADIMGAPYLRLRFDVVTGDACRKFHLDAVTARLVCAYRGKGTQYGIAAVGSEPREIAETETGAPILLRGTLWPERPKSGLLHRSPPIAGTGETRLLLVLDPVDDPDDHPDPAFLH